MDPRTTPHPCAFLGYGTTCSGVYVKGRDFTGQKFGRVTLLRYFGDVGKRRSLWSGRCDCGTEKLFSPSNLKTGLTISCGCARRELYYPKEYRSAYRCWSNMKSRCARPEHRHYKNYGGRGIQVCERWRNSFMDFMSDVGPRPSLLHSLDRYPDNDGNYEPGNVRWATRLEQANNKRNTRYLECSGKRLPIQDWSRLSGVPASLIHTRINVLGWPVERAILEPPRRPR